MWHQWTVYQLFQTASNSLTFSLEFLFAAIVLETSIVVRDAEEYNSRAAGVS
jgi:uncharacterized membrane protein